MAYLALKIDLLDLEYAEAIQKRRREMRDLRLAMSARQLLNAEYVGTYRLTKELVSVLIEDLVSLMPVSRGSLTPERKVLICLAFMASGSNQRTVGQMAMHGFSQSSICMAIEDVVNALNDPAILKKYIKFPTTRQLRLESKRRFHEEFLLPGVVGCVDGTQIAIHKPREAEENFLNRKHFHSLNVQIICDADLMITSVDASHGGSTHDSVIWGSHPLNDYLQALHAAGETLWLLGDSGYPQRETLMTPVLNAPAASPEAQYTELHVRARNCVERCIGVLKARWRCLSSARQLHYSPIKCAKIINACVVLHNIAHAERLEPPPLCPADELEERRLAAELDATQPNADPSQQTPAQRGGNVELMRGRAARAALIRSIMV